LHISAFKGLEGKKISVLLNRNKPSGEPESYIAILEGIGGEYIILDYNGASYKPECNPIEKMIMDVSIILSLWVYKE
jgi:hypothetical protein